MFLPVKLKADSTEILPEGLKDTDTIEILRYRAYNYYSNNDYGKSIRLYGDLITIVQESKQWDVIAEALFYLAKIYNNIAEYDSALKYGYASLKIYEIINDQKGIGASTNEIGFIYYKLKNYDISIQLFRRSLENFRELNASLYEAYAINNIAMVYFDREEYNKALNCFQEALEIKKREGDKKGMASTYNNIGEIYFKINDYDNSHEFYIRSLKIKEEIGYKRGMAATLTNLGELYLAKNDYIKANEYLSEALVKAKEMNLKKDLMNIYRLYYELKSKTGDIQSSFNHYRSYTEMKDSIYDEDINNRITAMHVHYETEKYRKELEIRNIRIENQRNRMILLLTGMVVIVIFLIVVFYQKRQQQRANKMLVDKNQKIMESEKKLILAREELEKRLDSQDRVLKELIQKQDTSVKQKYSDIKLSDDHKQELIRGIIRLMEKDKVFLDVDITVSRIAEMLDTNKTYIASIINIEFDRNFNSFINDYRINESIRLLSDKESEKLSIEGIALSSGFKSKSAFNRAFKNAIGVTPSFYMKSIRKE